MTETSIVVPASHRSRWGYHVCDRATYLKLKALNRLVERVKRLAAAQWRWDRKTVNQGVRWEKVRDASGRVIGRNRIEGDIPRPKCPLDYSKKEWHGGWYRYRGSRWAQSGIDEISVNLYRRARMPSVTPLAPLDADKLDRAMNLLKLLEAWERSISA